MKIDCRLEGEKKLPSEIRGLLKTYYSKVLGVKEDHFAEERWCELMQMPALVFYRVVANGETGGHVIVNSRNSTIVEIFLDEQWAVRGLGVIMMDRILEIHKLVSAEVSKSDVTTYTFLEEYGSSK